MNINVTFCEHSNTRIHTFATKEAEMKKKTLWWSSLVSEEKKNGLAGKKTAR